MLAVVLILLLATAFLLGVEYLSRRKKYPPEITRKFIHISGGTVAAFTPWFLSWHQIEAIAAVLFIIILISRIFHIFGSINSIERVSIGDLLFALSIAVVAIIAHDRLIFAAAILHMSLADGLAAVAGTSLGKKTGYKVFGRQNSLVGASVFWLCSLLILLWYLLVAHVSGNWSVLIWLPLVATVVEAIGIDGTDNLLVPLVVTVIINRL